MVKTEEEFHALMRDVLSGSETAAQEMFRDYGPFLLQAIRRRLSKKVRSKFDSLDIAQDVWASFFATQPLERKFHSQGELIAFLCQLARNKTIDVVRQGLNTQKRDVTREQSIDDSRRFDKDVLADVAQRTPSQILMSQEEWGEFLRSQPLVYRQIFVFLREGRTQEQIAAELGISVKTVNRVVCRIPSRSAHEQ